MIEKVNPDHPDKIADRIAGAIVDLGYKLQENPKIAVEVLIGHGNCKIIIESSVKYNETDIFDIVYRITRTNNIAIEIISNLIEKLQKENEELKRLHIQDNKHLDFIMEHSIPVQKVKDKIDEILNNGEYRIIFEGDAEFPDEATIINAQRYIKLEKLQELLEERKLEED